MRGRKVEKNVRQQSDSLPRQLGSGTECARCRTVWLAVLVTPLLLTGCQAPPTATEPTQMVLRIPDRDAFVDASLTILREYDFPPQRVDRARGLIVTGRTTGGQWFEPWRVDSQGPYQVLESSLHTIGRTATVTLEPTETSDDRYRVAVQVDKSRYSAPERQITTASGALAIYSERIPTREGLRRAQSHDASWVPLGRDPLLEGYLLAKLADATPDVEVTE